jgi:phosphohistidine phosphatase
MTRRLVLLRHAKSAWPDVPDHERPLAGRGRRDAPAVGRWLHEAGLTPDRVLCSTAQRTRETWQLAEAEIAGGRQGGKPQAGKPRVTYADEVYAASPQTLLDLVRRTAAATDSLLLIGHNPGIQDLALLLADPAADAGNADAGDTGTAPRERAAVKFPTAAVAVLEFTGAWSRLGPEKALLVTFVTPRDLRDSRA